MRLSSLNPESVVRVLAGTFVLIGCALAWWVDPWWLLLPAFVGINLIQSTFTGFCPALILLGLMQWRDVKRAVVAPAPRVSPAAVADRIRQGDAVLIDVREPAEWAKGVAQGAVLLPISDFSGNRERWAPFLAANKQKEIICYCAAGGRAGTIASALRAEGVNAANGGGFSEWMAAGWPVEKRP